MKKRRKRRQSRQPLLIVSLRTNITVRELEDKLGAMYMHIHGSERRFDLTIEGYDNDPREVYEIPEVAQLCRRLVDCGFIALLEASTLFGSPARQTLGAFEVWLLANKHWHVSARVDQLFTKFMSELPAIGSRCETTVRRVRTRNRAQSQAPRQHPLRRLDTLVHAWEDYWYVHALMARAAPILQSGLALKKEGALVNHGKFRSYLNSLGEKAGNLQEVTAYRAPANATAPSTLLTFHSAITMWCHHGRHAYHITSTAQDRLAAIELQGLSWSDIPYPFPAFVVTLERPLESALGYALDLFLVSTYCSSSFTRLAARYPDIEVNDFRGYPRRGDAYQALSPKQRQKIKQICERKQWPQFGMQAAITVKDVLATLGMAYLISQETLKHPILDTGTYDNTSGTSISHTPSMDMAHLIARLSLHLSTVNPEAFKWEQPFLGDSEQTIIRTAKVCTIA